MTNQDVRKAIVETKLELVKLKDESICPHHILKQDLQEALQILVDLAQSVLDAKIPDREKIIDTILKVAMGNHDDISAIDEANAVDSADEILDDFRLYQQKCLGELEEVINDYKVVEDKLDCHITGKEHNEQLGLLAQAIRDEDFNYPTT